MEKLVKFKHKLETLAREAAELFPDAPMTVVPMRLTDCATFVQAELDRIATREAALAALKAKAEADAKAQQEG